MPCRKSIIGKSGPEDGSNMPMEDASEDSKFSEAILLCFLASQNRSLFASKCLVETVVEMYRRGYTLDGLKIALALATLSSGEPALENALLASLSITLGVTSITSSITSLSGIELALDTAALPTDLFCTG